MLGCAPAPPAPASREVRESALGNKDVDFAIAVPDERAPLLDGDARVAPFKSLRISGRSKARAGGLGSHEHREKDARARRWFP